ncbi:hypothetical protein OUZ56_011475 [Daphnia magna]|uniref:Uncharacterized protein n=1 Tax=Daphnia magna TaxID=35525 RepID=A0ABQ9Z089_9CRUS|nr:hypothetical protein OUZ56_011475 [Daphnia magna]
MMEENAATSVAVLATELATSRLRRFTSVVNILVHRPGNSSFVFIFAIAYPFAWPFLPGYHGTSFEHFNQDKNFAAAKLKKKLIRKGIRQERYRFKHMKDREPAYRETASETTARLIAQRKPTKDMQAVILPAPQLPTPELLPEIPASLKVAEFILSSAPINPPSTFRPSVEPIAPLQTTDTTPSRIRLVYFRPATGREIDIQPPEPPEALRAALAESAQSRWKTGPRLADFISPPSLKKPRCYRPYSP